MTSESVDLIQKQVTKLAAQRLPVYGVSRVAKSVYGAVTFWQESALAKAQGKLGGLPAAVRTVDGYHLHIGNEGDAVSPKQALVYLKNNALWVNYITKTGERKSVTLSAPITYSAIKHPFVSIIEKINQKKGLSPAQTQVIFNAINAQNGDFEKTTNVLLKAMDEHIQALHQKMSLYAGLDTQVSEHKIALTKALIQFVEEPVESNWAAVRSAMNSNYKYAFTWTGQSQTDAFLNRVKILYAPDIKEFDKVYDQNNRNHAKSSWDLFFYHLGWMNYIFAIPDALCKHLLNQINDLHILIITSQFSPIIEQTKAATARSLQMTDNIMRDGQPNRIVFALYHYLMNSTDELISAHTASILAEFKKANPGLSSDLCERFINKICLNNRDEMMSIVDDLDAYLDSDYPPLNLQNIHTLNFNALTMIARDNLLIRTKLKSLHKEIIAVVGEPYASSVSLAP